MLDSKGRVLVFDSENVGFVHHVRQRNHCHVIHVIDYHTRENFVFFDDYEHRIDAVHLGAWETAKSGTYEDGVKFLRGAKCIIIQNGSGYDFHIFEKIFPKQFVGFNYFEATGDPEFPYKVMDTYTMSQTLNPERQAPWEAKALGMGNVGAHSIAAHGIRMGRYKPEHEDWSKLTADMLHRVAEDTEIGLDFFDYLMKEWRDQMNTPNRSTGYTISNAYYCELRVAFTMARQAIRGFALDVGLISELLTEMDTELNATEAAFRPFMPKRIVKATAKFSATQVSYLNEMLGEKEASLFLETTTHSSKSATVWKLCNVKTKQGHKVAASVTKIFPEMVGYIEDHQDPLVAGAFTPVVFEDYPMGNRNVIKELLYHYGWRGVTFNDKERDHIEKFDELMAKGKKKKAIEHGEMPFPWSGKIDEKSIKQWQRSAALAHGWVDDGEECVGEVELYCKKHDLVPEWALGIARWYIVQSRRTQILNAGDIAKYKVTGKLPSQVGGKKEIRGLLPKAICVETGMTGEEYFIKHGFFPDTGEWRVPAIAFHAATNTFRMRHRNVVNIPSRGIYGHEMRKIFIAGKGKVITGCDGAGLELRMLAHFMGDAEYTDIILNGDIHTYNQHKAGLPLRDNAKTFIYALLYGSGVANLARVCNMTQEAMSACMEEFRSSLPALAKLMDGVQVAAQRGFMLAIDGRRGRIRKRDGEYATHTALNVLLQMTGSIIMKWAHVIAEDLAVERGLIKNVGEFPIVAHQHDEAQMDTPDADLSYRYYDIPKSDWKTEEKAEYKDEKGQWSAASILEEFEENGVEMLSCVRAFSPLGNCYADGLRLAGEMFKMRCATAGEYLVGDSWAETH